jgi:tight adherence protein C
MIVLIFVIVLVVGAAVVLTIIGLRNPAITDEKLLQQRLEELTVKGEEEVNLEKIELSQPFAERVIFPIARSLGKLATRFTPQNYLNSIERNLELAGTSSRLDPTVFLALQFIGFIAFGGIVFLFFTLLGTQTSSGTKFLLVLVTSVIGFLFPQLYLRQQIQKRQKNVRRAMPDALDLLTICVEAGLGFDAAIQKVAEKWNSDLSMAFARVIQEIQLGKIRRDALRDMADRVGLAEMTSFVAAVIQSELLGVSLSKVLHIQADQMRMKRRQRAEEEARKAPLKMLIPMAILIFPSLIIVLMAPAGLKLMHSSLLNLLP